MKLLAYALWLIPALCMGTAQFPERLEREGKEYSLHSQPLDIYTWVKGIDFDFQKAFDEGENSGCWRGYVGHWQIRDQKLYLREITSPLGEKKLPLSTIFAKTETDGVFCEWFSGYLSYADGPILYRSDSYSEAFERWVFLKVDSGIIVEEVSRSGHSDALRLMVDEFLGPEVSIKVESKNFGEAFLITVEALSEALKNEGRWPDLDDWKIKVDLPSELEEVRHTLNLEGIRFSQAIEFLSKGYAVNFSIVQSKDDVLIKVRKVEQGGGINSEAAPHRD